MADVDLFYAEKASSLHDEVKGGKNDGPAWGLVSFGSTNGLDTGSMNEVLAPAFRFMFARKELRSSGML